jgi:carbonic anhydrase
MCRALHVFADLAIVMLSACSALGQHPPTVSADQIWNDLTAGNHRFVMGKTASRDLVTQRQALAKSQHPRVTVLSCSDSRVPPELVFDAGLGDSFVVRSAGESELSRGAEAVDEYRQ